MCRMGLTCTEAWSVPGVCGWVGGVCGAGHARNGLTVQMRRAKTETMACMVSLSHTKEQDASVLASQYEADAECSPAPLFCMITQVTARGVEQSSCCAETTGERSECKNDEERRVAGRRRLEGGGAVARNVPTYLKGLLADARLLRMPSTMLDVHSCTFFDWYTFVPSTGSMACGEASQAGARE